MVPYVLQQSTSNTYVLENVVQNYPGSFLYNKHMEVIHDMETKLISRTQVCTWCSWHIHTYTEITERGHKVDWI